MPRTSDVSLEKQIKIIDEKIEKATAHIKSLKDKRQELLDKKEALAMQELTKILMEKNMTAVQAADILRNHNM